MKLIELNALIAEIERRKSELQSRIAELGTFESNTLGLFQEVDLYDDILSFIYTLEVKEVDFTKEVDMWIKNNGDTNGFFNVQELAKHFFELGLKAQHQSVSIQNIDDVLKELGIDPYSREAKMLKESYYAAMDKAAHAYIECPNCKWSER